MADRERGPEPASASAEIGKYLDILAKDPNSRVFAPLAESYRKAGLLDDAIVTALEGLKVHPTYLGGRVALGRAYFEKGQFLEAAAEMQKVVKAAPDNLMAHKILGRIAYSQNDLAAAEKALKMVLLLDPRDQETQQLLVKIGGGAPPEPTRQQPHPSAPAPSPMVAAAPAPITQPAPIEDFELPALSLEEVPPPPIRPPPQDLPEELSVEDLSIDIPMPDAREAEPAVPASPPPAAAPPPSPALELEVFSRVPWGSETAHVPPAGPVAPAEAAVTPAPGRSVHEEPVFEVFGRPKREGPPVSSKGEREIYTEIELEPTAHAPTEAPAASGEESPFEMFTREPHRPTAGVRSRPVRSEGGEYHDIELEPTAYVPPALQPEDAAQEVMPPPAADEFDHAFNLEEELPRIDLAREVEPEPGDEELVPGDEELPGIDLAREVEPEPVDEELVLGDEELPGIDLAREVEPESPAPDAAEPAAARGVFDTETLATIYINQGFYGRAAEIYQRLVEQRPGDADLRLKLENVLALERAEHEPASAAPAAVAPPAAHAVAAAAPSRGPDRQVRRLEELLEAFKGGRPR